MKVSVSNGVKSLLLVNIVAIVGAVITIIWSAATLSHKVETLEAEQRLIRGTQVELVVGLAKVTQSLTDLQSSQTLLMNRFLREGSD